MNGSVWLFVFCLFNCLNAYLTYYRYECFKQERAVNYLSITLLLTFSIIVSVVSFFFAILFFILFLSIEWGKNISNF